MAESSIAVSTGAGKNIHTNDRTISAVLVQDQVTIPGEHYLPGYIVSPAAPVSVSSTGLDVLQLMAGGTLVVRVRRIRVEQAGLQTSAALFALTVWRVTSAGTGGTAITPSKVDSADPASGATAASGVPNATHGTIGAQIFPRSFTGIQTAPVGGMTLPEWEWVQQPGMKPIIIPAGAANGLVIRVNAASTMTVNAEIEFVETSFV